MFWNMIHVQSMFKVLNMISCSRTWFHVPEHEFMFRKHALCLRTWIMFWNMKSCSGTWIMFKSCSGHKTWFWHDFMFWNMISCSRTWNRVPKTCSMFKNTNHVLEYEIMFWNMISCSDHGFWCWTWHHVPEHGITWFHVLEHDFMFRSCSARTWFRHVRTCFEHAWTCFKHRACSGMFRALNMIWTWGALGRWISMQKLRKNYAKKITQKLRVCV